LNTTVEKIESLTTIFKDTQLKGEAMENFEGVKDVVQVIEGVKDVVQVKGEDLGFMKNLHNLISKG